MSKKIDEIIRKSTDWRGNKLSEPRKVIRQTDSEIIEEVKWKKLSKSEGVSVWSRVAFCALQMFLRML